MPQRRGLFPSFSHVRFLAIFAIVLLLSAVLAGGASAQDEPPTPALPDDTSAPEKDAAPAPASLSAAVGGDAYEPDDTPEQASEILPGTPQIHSLSPAGDYDWMTFTLDVPSEVVLETSSDDPFLPHDTVMYLYDASLAQIEVNDDFTWPTLYSYIDRTCDHDWLPAGTYFVMIKDFGSPEEIPTYTLSLTASDCLELRTPLGATTDTTPRFRWTEFAGATGYTLWVQHSESGQTIWQKTWATALCREGICAATTQRPRGHGDYRWMVTAHTPGGDVPSRWEAYSVSSAVPQLITPSGGTTDTTPRYRWTAAERATAYELLVTRTSDGAEVFRKTYAPRICEAGRCAVTPGLVLPPDEYTYRVQAVYPLRGTWSEPGQFTVR